MSSCEARILAWPARIDTEGIAGIADCVKDSGHVGDFHEGPIVSHGLDTRLSWLDTDRRNFRGALHMCPSHRCTLPLDHPGDHAP